jgi:hypothetical protein
MKMIFCTLPLMISLLCLPVNAQSSFESSVFGSGGLVGAGTQFGIRSTVGQGIIGSFSNSLTIHHAGFWTIQKSTGPVSAKLVPGIPLKPVLHQNYPNPFNPSTTIRFSIPERQHVRLSVYDLLGREVATLVDEEKDAGWYSVMYDASRLASGVYLYRIQADSFVLTKRFILLK